MARARIPRRNAAAAVAGAYALGHSQRERGRVITRKIFVDYIPDILSAVTVVGTMLVLTGALGFILYKWYKDEDDDI